jgi:hypothetical protein
MRSSIAAGYDAMSKKGRCTHSPLFDSDPLAVGIHLAYKVIANDSSNYNWCLKQQVTRTKIAARYDGIGANIHRLLKQ